MDDREQLGEVFKEISNKGLLTLEYYEGYFGFLIFWYYFTSFLIMSFALLYYRKYLDK